MGIDKDITPGDKFGKLTFVRESGFRVCSNGSKKRKGTFICECGTEREVILESVRSGNTKTCGCTRRASLLKANTTHGLTSGVRSGEAKPPSAYFCWCHMRRRCSGKTKDAKHYKDRGIGICSRWDSFEAFLADMGPRPSAKHSIDRIDNSKGYSPENCRWATQSQQMRNTRRSKFFTFYGMTKHLNEWSELSQVPANLIRHRLYEGWTPREAVWANVGTLRKNIPVLSTSHQKEA